MSQKLKLQSERRKLQLKAVVLNNRARVAALNEQTAKARAELSQFKGRRSSNAVAPVGGLRNIKL